MPRLPCALLLSYDGQAFRGWQRQPGMRTVQEAVERALGSALGKRVQIFGAARTDAGVHADGQVCHFVKESIASQAALGALASDLRARLPTEITLRDAALAHPSFHARSSSIGKRYRYRFAWGPGLAAGAIASDPYHLAAPAPGAVAPHFAQAHAFQLGPSAAPDWSCARAALESLSALPALPGLASPSTDRRPAPPLSRWLVVERGQSCALEVEAPAFRKHQVRNLAGHLAAIALGLAGPDSLAQLAARTRPWMGACAPPHGLTLLGVDYPPQLDPFPGPAAR